MMDKEQLKQQSIITNQQVDRELLKLYCEQLSAEERAQLTDEQVQFLGKQILSEAQRNRLRVDVRSIIQHNKVSK